jgi:uncharacterized cofD-like protein
VVTVGGGHGQAALLSALTELDCSITAVVGVADDGGCSGLLRAEFGMPPPGDVRRCLSTLAQNKSLAERFEQRLPNGADAQLRSAGNLVLFEAYMRSGNFQRAIDWASALLDCAGAVVSAAEVPGELATYDRFAGILEGESNIAKRSAAPMVAAVRGAERAHPRALTALASADLVLIGPGSFVTSVLATVSTGEIAGAIVRSPGRRALVRNLRAERGQAEPSLTDQARLLRDHLVIHSQEDDFEVEVLAHDDAMPLASDADPGQHDPERLAAALIQRFGFTRRREERALADHRATHAIFDEHLARARLRLSDPRAIASS